jgi:succinate dehydrogenase / fumarate reductase, cytochrome b subunit
MWLIDSSIGRKLMMSVTGVFLVLFLLFHSVMNIVVIISPEGYNAICGFLGANWYAIAGTSVLAAGFVIHIIYAFYLTYQNKLARGSEAYAVTSSQPGVSWASKNMVALGGVILGFLVLHMYNFWFKMQFAELTGIHTGSFDPTNGAAYVKELFSSNVYCLLYIVWLGALWFHLTHGVWSALQTTGLNNKIWLPRVKVISNVISTIVVLMFMSIPLYFLLGCGVCCK